MTAVLISRLLYQGYNAIYLLTVLAPSPNTIRVGAMAIRTQFDFSAARFPPTLCDWITPPRDLPTSIPLIIGGAVFMRACMAVLAATAARKIYRIPLSALDEWNTCAMDNRWISNGRWRNTSAV